MFVEMHDRHDENRFFPDLVTYIPLIRDVAFRNYLRREIELPAP